VTTLVIGDVHGCADELEDLLARVAPSRVVLVGDLYTRGPYPERVHAVVRSGGFEVVRGNHDQRLLDARAGLRPSDAHAHDVARRLDAVDPGWVEAVAAWPLWATAGRYLVTHAALHPSGDLARTSPATHLFARRWPDDRSDANPFWWQVYEGPPVIFGHDAVRGHVRVDRGGEPWVIGLDTGCVYGRELSAWVVEEERRIAVPARRAWAPISRRPQAAPGP